jgi:hypothetical protein
MIVPLSADRPLVDKGARMTQQTRLFMNQVAALGPLQGVGSPEGVVAAVATQTYMDEAGTAGAVVYIKQVNSIGGDKTLGWVLV